MSKSTCLSISCAFAILSGCSWVDRYYVFAPSGPSNGWQYRYVEGEQKSVKDVPTPDLGSVSFANTTVMLEVQGGEHKQQVAAGPLWFPLIPSGGSSEDQQLLSLRMIIVSRDKPLAVDVSKIRFVINQSAKPSLFRHEAYFESGRRWAAEPQSGSIPVKASGRLEIFFDFDQKVTEVNRIELQISGITDGLGQVPVPSLALRKVKGRLNYDELTL